MHNISMHQIKELAEKLAKASSSSSTEELLAQARELYEKIILLHYVSDEGENKTVDNNNKINESTEVDLIESPIVETSELSVQERIKQIMDSAPQFEPTKKEEQKKFFSDANSDIDLPQKKEVVIEQAESIPIIDDNKDDVETIKPETSTPKPSLEEELKDAISADYAANLFEKADKIEITKKSLNDKLSQKQLQIGLNDRIAFVKHLFNNSQSDFNRVLSQLNSFHSESQAKEFINTIVKPEYSWDSKIEYEERLIILIEKRFL